MICPVCNVGETEVFIEVDQIPVFCNVLSDSKEEAQKCAKGDVALGFCHNCGHIYNTKFEPELMEYDVEYENTLDFSPKFQAYIKELGERLVETYEIKNKKVLDIGCGKGDFLKLLCDLGDNEGFGFDPAYEEGRNDGPKLHYVQDYYSEKYKEYQADLFVCKHVLEHVEDPVAFIQDLREIIGHNKSVVYFEMPNVLWTIRDFGIWDILYEHYSYFSKHSLSYLFRKCGFNVERVEEAFGNQYLGIDSTPAIADEYSDDLSEMKKLFDDFKVQYKEKKDSWASKLKELEGKKVVLWGAGTKGIMFLNLMDANLVEYIVDINPHKHGSFVAGAGQEIIGPEFLKEYKPDAVIIMNPLYGDEIQKSLSDMGLEPEILFA